ncbi:MAG TPA: hypothetical protein VMY18_01570, partial [Acidobacteriota bacterium]|nr:hypothetical protein [Acidobacteriota bacterium]
SSDVMRFQNTVAQTERLRITAAGDILPAATNKTEDLGQAGNAWDDCYADDFINEADYYFLDDRPDLEALRKIMGSGIYDPINGLELIDDDTLPEWILKRNKKDGVFPNRVPYWQGDIARSPETGNPYLSGKAVDSWLMGAIRELDRRVDPIDKIREMVERLGGVEKVEPALKQLMAA